MDPFAIQPDQKQKYAVMFATNKDLPNAISGNAARSLFTKSGLGQDLLFKIWKMADVDKNGELDEQEFHIAAHLISVAVKKLAEIPENLPPSLVPDKMKGGRKDDLFPSGGPAFPMSGSSGPPPLSGGGMMGGPGPGGPPPLSGGMMGGGPGGPPPLGGPGGLMGGPGGP
eukprot:RCo050562